MAGCSMAAGLALRLWIGPRTQSDWFLLMLCATPVRLAAWAVLWRLDRLRWGRAPIRFEGGPGPALAHCAALLALWGLFLADAAGGAWSWTQRAAGVAVSCVVGGYEEFLFRGLVLSALLGLMSRPAAVLSSAVAFTLFHSKPESLPAWPHIFLTGVIFANLRLSGLGLGWLGVIHAVIDSAFFFVGYERVGSGVHYWVFLAGLYLYAAWSYRASGEPRSPAAAGPPRSCP